MRLMRLHLALLLATSLIVFSAQPVYAQQLSTPEMLTFTVYADGAVHVEYVVAVDPEALSVNIELLGETFEDLTVADENGLPLEYNVSDSVLTMVTLGAEKVTVAYDTFDLTNKTGRYWVLGFESPINAVIILPPEAVIISLSHVPESIESKEGRTILIMPKGIIEVTYTISVAGTKEHAAALIKEAEETVAKAKSQGIEIDEAENLLEKAKEAFNAGSYAQAESFTKQAKKLSEEALKTSTTTTPKPSPTSPVPWILGVIVAIVIVAAVFLGRKARKTVGFQSLPKPVKVSLDRIIEEHGEFLRVEDREALSILANSEGRIFESELREKLKLPKTSLWRLVRRLEKLGIVEVRKVGGQNLVCVKPKYAD
jgi:uncharacterized membrane protein